MKLKNKVAIVTGAASGLGKSIALKFASEGATVVVADLHLEKAQAVVKEILQKKGKAIAIMIDVSKEEQVDKGMEEVLQQTGSIDILVSNAGIQHIDPIEKLSFDHWKKILEVHLDGSFLMTRACLRAMYAAKKGGSILYIGSVHSKVASILKAPYVTAKHGLEGLCKVVAKEGAAHHVRANMICPGFVRTPLVDQQIPEQAKTLGISEEKVIQEILLKDTVDGEFTTSEDIAEAALFFASFESNALTGQSLIVSHGWCMQ